MSNQIEIPKVLVQQQEFCLKISQNNSKVFTHVEYLRGLVTNIHQMYSQLCKKLIHVTDDYQRKIITTVKVQSAHSQVILQLIKSVSLQHCSISNQLNSNSVTLGTKTHRIARNRVENLKERLVHCNEICKEYLFQIRQFNSKEKEFNRGCQDFKDYEKDVIKYYSIKSNVQSSDKLQVEEIQLKQNLQSMFRKKQDFQAQIHQVRAGLKDFFELEKNIISQYCKLLLNIRKVNRQAAQVYAQPILQLNEPSQSHMSNTNRDDLLPTKRSQKPSFEKTATQIRKQIVKDEQKIVILQSLLEQFINEFQQSLKTAAQKIDQLRSSKQYKNFSNDKMVMSEILSYESIREVDLIVNQISLFRTILLNLNTIFGKMKVIKEISKYRISNLDKFVDDTQQFIDQQRKGSLSSSQKQIFRKYQSKFIERNTQLTSRYRQRIIELQESIMNQYKRQDIAYEQKNKKVFKNDLFQKAYYQTLMSRFFLNRNESIIYKGNPHLKKIKNHLSANQVQKIIILQGFSKPIKYKPRKNCCGGLFEWGNDQQQKMQILTEYHCALKDGLMLIQGKMKLYEHFLRFYSKFNAKTLFGYTDIRIPKWDIYQIVPGKHLLSVKITLQTTHGNLDFTNFMTMQDPYQKLLEFYDTRKNVGSIVHKDNQMESQLIQLQQRFQSDFQAELLKVRIIVDTLSTYLSQDKQKLSISIEYHVNGSSWHAMFEIKIVQKTTSTDYYFIHDRQSNNNQIKSLIENVSKKLINMKDTQLISNINAQGKQKDLSFSIIEANQKNKLSFQREPSFINIKGGQNFMEDINLQEMRISHLQLGPLLTSRILSGIETSRNYEFDTKIASQNKITQSEPENVCEIIPKILFTPKKDEQLLQRIGQTDSYSMSISKYALRKNSSISKNYLIGGETRKQKINYTKVQSTKSKSVSNAQKYQGIFYGILILFVVNLILNWIDK